MYKAIVVISNIKQYAPFRLLQALFKDTGSLSASKFRQLRDRTKCEILIYLFTTQDM